MTDTGTTVTIRPERASSQLVPDDASDGDEDPAVREWFAGAAPAARSPWKGTTKVGMK